jgi:hypothetical protein
MTFDFETKARELCVAHGVPVSQATVKCVVAAMEYAAGEVAAQAAVKIRRAADAYAQRRDRANAPQ